MLATKLVAMSFVVMVVYVAIFMIIMNDVDGHDEQVDITHFLQHRELGVTRRERHVTKTEVAHEAGAAVPWEPFRRIVCFMSCAAFVLNLWLGLGSLFLRKKQGKTSEGDTHMYKVEVASILAQFDQIMFKKDTGLGDAEVGITSAVVAEESTAGELAEQSPMLPVCDAEQVLDKPSPIVIGIPLDDMAVAKFEVHGLGEDLFVEHTLSETVFSIEGQERITVKRQGGSSGFGQSFHFLCHDGREATLRASLGGGHLFQFGCMPTMKVVPRPEGVGYTMFTTSGDLVGDSKISVGEEGSSVLTLTLSRATDLDLKVAIFLSIML
uniref:Uncharacterized protein n=1 Tax=Noctiluca scintillans TaxID=2966 RepID=A0A7S1AQ01_NOCSC|mmetsp:Transcript_55163/g.147224  ORF Transcript_55163/g.147224 Transcript_55163/m.147224 type:complete len:324 (+) Transcript_55163:62-1033(+)